jgi:hypothetical protein
LGYRGKGGFHALLLFRGNIRSDGVTRSRVLIWTIFHARWFMGTAPNLSLIAFSERLSYSTRLENALAGIETRSLPENSLAGLLYF